MSMGIYKRVPQSRASWNCKTPRIHNMTTDLESLRDIIVSSVDRIVRICEETGKEFPPLDKPAHPSEFSSESIRNNPMVADNINLAVAAASQLIATLRPPSVHLWNSAFKVCDLKLTSFQECFTT